LPGGNGSTGHAKKNKGGPWQRSTLGNELEGVEAGAHKNSRQAKSSNKKGTAKAACPRARLRRGLNEAKEVQAPGGWGAWCEEHGSVWRGGGK